MTTSLPLDHSGLGVLPREECLRRLGSARVGRVAFVSQGDPVILPVNHGMDGESVIFRTASGSKLLASDSELPVAFEVDGYDVDRRAGWSVMVRGVATTVEDQEEIKRLNLIGVWPWADLVERNHWVRIRTFSVTGRQTVHPVR
ncbi:MAG TPA: pyridoxamine 5'-phosphate oxidase family protein [Nakamurella sp.]